MGLIIDPYRFTQVFSPDQISNLYSWHDASVLADITKDGSNRVSQWNDKSGNAKHFTSAGGNMPLWISASQNGKNVIDTVDSRYMTYTMTTQSQPITICMAMQLPTDANGFSRIIRCGTTAYAIYGHTATADQFAIASTTSQSFTEVGLDGNWKNSTIIFNGASSVLYINNVSKIAANTGTQGFNTEPFWLGVNADNYNLFSNTKYGEIIVYAKELNATERGQINTYFINKWGL